MAKRRDYRAEYAARNERAKAQGWRGYPQKGRARVQFKKDADLRRKWYRYVIIDKQIESPEGYGPSTPLFAAYYRAFLDPKESQRRDKDSARAHWFVDITGQVPDYDTWDERYGKK